MPAHKGYPPGLTPKRMRFIEEYLVDLNAAEAAIRAGYAPARAKEEGWELMNTPAVREQIDKLMAERSERTGVTADRVVQELAKIAFSDPRAVMSWGPDGVTLKESDVLTDDEAATVAEVGETVNAQGTAVRLKLQDKVRALEMLGKHLGMFVERREVSGTLNTVNMTADEFDERAKQLISDV